MGGEEAVGSGRRACKYACRPVMFTIPMLMLIWISCNGYKLATTTSDTKVNSSGDSKIALLFGVVTVIFGLIYFVVGLSIVAELALDFLAWVQQGNRSTSTNEEKERATICEIFVRTLAIMVSMCMLAWAIYYGYNLAAGAREVVIYSRWMFLIGVISMAFGFTYFIIGMGIVAETALDLSGRLLQEDGNHDALLDKQTQVDLQV